MNIPDDALRLKASRDRRLRGIDGFIAASEAELGEITDGQMEAAYRRAKARAVVVRGGHVVDDKRLPLAALAALGRDLLVADLSEADEDLVGGRDGDPDVALRPPVRAPRGGGPRRRAVAALGLDAPG
jgi:hypothetical protein